jgi:hypothetical protein
MFNTAGMSKCIAANQTMPEDCDAFVAHLDWNEKPIAPTPKDEMPGFFAHPLCRLDSLDIRPNAFGLLPVLAAEILHSVLQSALFLKISPAID